jgi:hypothetical protein
MGRLKDKDKNEMHKKVDGAKDMLEKLNSENKADSTMKEIFDIIKAGGNDVVSAEDDRMPKHLPMNTLEKIKEKLGEKVKVKDEDGNEILQPIYKEEEKIKAIFGLLSERGLNLLDFLEKTLSEAGYTAQMVGSINETMDRTTQILRDIAEIQYRKAKLENERTHLEIQKYKADLKKREIEIKEKANENGSGNTNVIAVGNPSELIAIMEGKRNIQESVIIDEEEENEDA